MSYIEYDIQNKVNLIQSTVDRLEKKLNKIQSSEKVQSISEKEIKDYAEQISDSRLNSHDTSACINGIKWICQKFNINIT